MDKLIRPADVVRKFGVSKSALYAACKTGRLRAENVAPPESKKSRWLFTERDFQSWYETLRPNGESWSEADEAAVIELYTTCSNEKIGHYIGRTRSSVASKITSLIKEGRVTPDKSHRKFVPWHIPSGAILLAKTCPQCGRLRSQRFYSTDSRGFVNPLCRDCKMKNQGKQRRGGEDLQRISEDRATRHRAEWTSEEMTAIEDVSRSSFELAIALGRTYYSITNRRQAQGVVQRPNRERLGEWVISLTPNNELERQVFHDLSVVPESEWDWNDEEIA